MTNRLKIIYFIITIFILIPIPALAGYLTLPVDITISGSIYSWFDHDMTASTSMTKYTGEVFSGPVASLSDCDQAPNDGSGCYDGHNGTDFATSSGAIVKAPADGVIRSFAFDTTNGWLMRIWHPGLGSTTGLSTLYAHLGTTTIATTSDFVERFEPIAYVDSTGLAFGPHLHFGVTDSDDMAGNRLDPFGWSGTTTDPWSYNQGYLWTTNPPSFEVPSTWYNSNWDYRVKVTVDHTKVSDDLKGFPIYVNLSDLPSDFHTHVRTDGGDIRVTKADGHTELPREVVSYNAGTDSGELYFRSTLISPNVDMIFYIYYGNSAAADYSSGDTYGRNATWDDYSRVYHGSATDSSGTANGSFGGSVSEATTTTKLGTSAVSFPSNSTSNHFLAGNFYGRTIQGWIRNTDTDNYSGYFVDACTDVDNGWSYFNNTASSSDLYHGSPFTSYMNGLPTGGSGLATTTFNSWNMVVLRSSGLLGDPSLHFGNRYGGRITDDAFVGQMDELRITETRDLSPEWILTDYRNQNSPSTFYDVGIQETE